MRYCWAEDTQFTEVVLSVEQEVCSECQRRLHVCDHRFHPILSLQRPPRLVCKLAHCPEPACPAHHHTLSPLAEARPTSPYWLIGWDVFSWLGFHRYGKAHVLRDLSKPMREQDSGAKGRMRKKVRGLRDIERQVLEDRREAQAEPEGANAAAASSAAAAFVVQESSPGQPDSGAVV